MKNKVNYMIDINIDLYQINVLVVIGDRTDVPSEFKFPVEMDAIPEEYQGICNLGKYATGGQCKKKPVIYKDKPYKLIWIDGYKSNDEIIVTLMHEYEHAVDDFMKAMKMDKDSEPRAYMIGHLTRCSLEIMKELLR